MLEESLELTRALGDSGGVAWSMMNLGDVAQRDGDYGTAVALSEKSLAPGRELGFKGVTAWSLMVLADVARRRGDLPRATRLYRKALAHHWEMGQRRSAVQCLERLAVVAAASGQASAAVRLYAAAQVGREGARAPLPPTEQTDYQEALTATRLAMGDEAVAAAAAEGRAMTLEQAIEHAVAAGSPA